LSHSRKILSQAGTSLADSYDVEGSIVGIENLDASDVKLVHEMGATIVSERMNSLIIQGTTGAISQSTTWDVSLGQPPDVFNRILAVFVEATAATRINFCSIALADIITGEEIPFFTWDVTPDATRVVRWSNQGAAAANVFQLVPSLAPPLRSGPDDSDWERQTNAANDISREFRGIRRGHRHVHS